MFMVLLACVLTKYLWLIVNVINQYCNVNTLLEMYMLIPINLKIKTHLDQTIMAEKLVT